MKIDGFKTFQGACTRANTSIVDIRWVYSKDDDTKFCSGMSFLQQIEREFDEEEFAKKMERFCFVSFYAWYDVWITKAHAIELTRHYRPSLIGREDGLLLP